MNNDFQRWLISQGYYRKTGSLLWFINDKVVKGKTLSIKWQEWKALSAK